MAIYCSEACEMTGSICDFCTHYRDDFTNNEFQGEGYCEAKRMRVDACDACDDDFCCFKVKERPKRRV